MISISRLFIMLFFVMSYINFDSAASAEHLTPQSWTIVSRCQIQCVTKLSNNQEVDTTIKESCANSPDGCAECWNLCEKFVAQPNAISDSCISTAHGFVYHNSCNKGCQTACHILKTMDMRQLWDFKTPPIAKHMIEVVNNSFVLIYTKGTPKEDPYVMSVVLYRKNLHHMEEWTHVISTFQQPIPVDAGIDFTLFPAGEIAILTLVGTGVIGDFTANIHTQIAYAKSMVGSNDAADARESSRKYQEATTLTYEEQILKTIELSDDVSEENSSHTTPLTTTERVKEQLTSIFKPLPFGMMYIFMIVMVVLFCFALVASILACLKGVLKFNCQNVEYDINDSFIHNDLRSPRRREHHPVSDSTLDTFPAKLRLLYSPQQSTPKLPSGNYARGTAQNIIARHKTSRHSDASILNNTYNENNSVFSTDDNVFESEPISFRYGPRKLRFDVKDLNKDLEISTHTPSKTQVRDTYISFTSMEYEAGETDSLTLSTKY